MQVDRFDLTPEQREVEGALSGMVPVAVSIDRDELMFAAGRASVRGAVVWPWRAAACVGLSLSVGLGVMGMHERPTQPGTITKKAPSSVEILEARNEGAMAAVLSQVNASLETGTESSPWSYYNLREEALNWGVDVLPTAPNGGAGGAVVKEERVGKGSSFGFSFRQLMFNAGGPS